jgi:hypothetical protein
MFSCAASLFQGTAVSKLPTLERAIVDHTFAPPSDVILSREDGEGSRARSYSDEFCVTSERMRGPSALGASR